MNLMSTNQRTSINSQTRLREAKLEIEGIIEASKP